MTLVFFWGFWVWILERLFPGTVWGHVYPRSGLFGRRCYLYRRFWIVSGLFYRPSGFLCLDFFQIYNEIKNFWYAFPISVPFIKTPQSTYFNRTGSLCNRDLLFHICWVIHNCFDMVDGYCCKNILCCSRSVCWFSFRWAIWVVFQVFFEPYFF